jgi:hypothetical protein
MRTSIFQLGLAGGRARRLIRRSGGHACRLNGLRLLAVIAFTGCTFQPQSPMQLSDRLKNAAMINDLTTRDQSLKQIALDSANSGVPSVCQQAVSAMGDSTDRDDTAEQATYIFDDRGDRPSAEAMVALIEDGVHRDRMRQHLAAEPYKAGMPVPSSRP